ncbi:MAG: helix-turn-helix domain-containing protein [Clostridia bacterium]|nr:helix-turn-helix domain-containing protein [Clostridia bacterium]
MYIEKRHIRKITKVFEGLSIPIRLVDASGQCIAPEGGNDFNLPDTVLSPSINHKVGRSLCRGLDMNPPVYLVTEASGTSVEDLLTVADAMLMTMLKSSYSISSCSDVYRRVLRQELSSMEINSHVAEHQIPVDMKRCVMVFRLEHTEKSAYTILGELMPLGDSDVLVEMNRSSAALIKDMQGVDGIEELTQFALAVRETVMEEAALSVTVGIGEEKNTLMQLGESYAEAKRALEVGFLFHPEKCIYDYAHLLLERFLMGIPPEDCQHFHSLLFNRRTSKLFNEEMLQTIDMFFRKDLNLSDTARQLFIHRNTLVYRLDKVQRLTGLDLRHFDDAVTFKILNELSKCGKEKPAAVE